MIDALDEGQSGDDLRSRIELERIPPGSAGRQFQCGRTPARGPDLPGAGNRSDHARGANMRNERHRKTKVEARRVAHGRITGGQTACTQNGACT